MSVRGSADCHGPAPGDNGMIIDRLVLKNFKRFKDEEIHFKDGITGILGNNGTGKSSLVEAIFFALYGIEKTGSLQSNYIISSFASEKEQCEVRLDFQISGDNYSVLRTFKNGKTIANKTTFHKGENSVRLELKKLKLKCEGH